MKLSKLFPILLPAVLALAACGPTAPTGGRGPGTAPTNLPPPPATVPGDSAQAEAQPPHDPFAGLTFREGWARIPFNFTVFGGYGTDQMNAVTAGGPGVVAAGFSIREGDMDAAVWVSENGVDWRKLEQVSALEGLNAQVIETVAQGENGLVAAGMETVGTDTNAAVWFSRDGLEWQRVPASGQVFGDGNSQKINHVIAFGDGFVAVGIEKSAGGVFGAVWTSPDGLTWQRSAAADPALGGPERYVSLERVFTVGSSLLAIGTVQVPGENDVDGSTWFSHDSGLTWTEITNSASVLGDPEGARYQLIGGLTQTNAGFFMVGTEQNPAGSPSGEFINGVIWRSTDGVSWERIFDHKPDYHLQSMFDITSFAGGYAIVGTDQVGEQTQAVVWMSADGVTWRETPHSETVFGGPGIQQMNAVTAAGPGLVAVGSTTETGEQDAAVWIFVPQP